jgi:hypothetical protein
VKNRRRKRKQRRTELKKKNGQRGRRENNETVRGRPRGETIVNRGGRTADRRKHPRSRGEEPEGSKREEGKIEPLQHR